LNTSRGISIIHPTMIRISSESNNREIQLSKRLGTRGIGGIGS